MIAMSAGHRKENDNNVENGVRMERRFLCVRRIEMYQYSIYVNRHWLNALLWLVEVGRHQFSTGDSIDSVVTTALESM